jgi:hypothetical protein
MIPKTTPERLVYERGELRRLERHLKETHRPPITLSRLLDAQIDPAQLPVKSARSLRITQADVDAGLADIADLGKFWFVDGYSTVGGPDVPRP